jgi:predicted RNA-binding protein with PIN domain
VKKSLQSARKALIDFLQKKFVERGLSGTLVFDGKEISHAYPSPLTVVFAEKSADAYIIERLELSKMRKQIVVVTNDLGLTRHVKSLGAKRQSNEDFLAYLQKKKKRTPKDPVESKQNFDRLLRLFEEKLKEN